MDVPCSDSTRSEKASVSQDQGGMCKWMFFPPSISAETRKQAHLGFDVLQGYGRNQGKRNYEHIRLRIAERPKTIIVFLACTSVRMSNSSTPRCTCVSHLSMLHHYPQTDLKCQVLHQDLHTIASQINNSCLASAFYLKSSRTLNSLHFRLNPEDLENLSSTIFEQHNV